MLKLLADIRSICEFLIAIFGVMLATLVVKDASPEWQFVWAVIILVFLAIAVVAKLTVWMIHKAAVSQR